MNTSQRCVFILPAQARDRLRDWLAIERLLWAGAMSYMALLVLRSTFSVTEP